MLNDKNLSFLNMSKRFCFKRQAQIKPIFFMCALQSRHGHFQRFHFLILALSYDSYLICFRSNSNVSLVFGPK